VLNQLRNGKRCAQSRLISYVRLPGYSTATASPLSVATSFLQRSSLSDTAEKPSDDFLPFRRPLFLTGNPLCQGFSRKIENPLKQLDNFETTVIDKYQGVLRQPIGFQFHLQAVNCRKMPLKILIETLRGAQVSQVGQSSDTTGLSHLEQHLATEPARAMRFYEERKGERTEL
jgi:hypothetical protein